MSNNFDLFDILIGKQNDSDYKKKPVIIQGITGASAYPYAIDESIWHKYYRWSNPRQRGSRFEDIPVFDSVKDAIRKTGAKISGMFVPAPYFLDVG